MATRIDSPARRAGRIGEEGRPGVAFLLALALHAGALGGMVFWSSKAPRTAPGEQEIAIDLAPAMQTAEPVAPPQSAAPAEVLSQAAEVKPAELVTMAEPPPQAVEAEPQEAREVPPPAAVAQAPPPETVQADEPQVVAAIPPPPPVAAQPVREKPQPKPEKKPEPLKAERRQPLRKAVAEERSAPSAPRQGAASSSREDSGGAAAAADPTVMNRYAAQLAAALRARLRFPEAARGQGLTGIAMVRVTMHRSGRILSASLVRGTGHSILDQAALGTVAPGTALPAAPEALPQQQLTLSVPLRFDLVR